MKTISRDEIKKKGIRRLRNSFRYSLEGLIYAYRNEQSMLLHFMATVLCVTLGAIFGIDAMEWMIVIMCLAIIMIVELFNTAIEAVVDMVTLEVNPLAKIAKDCGSAAAFVASIISTIVIASVFFPYFINLF